MQLKRKFRAGIATAVVGVVLVLLTATPAAARTVTTGGGTCNDLRFTTWSVTRSINDVQHLIYINMNSISRAYFAGTPTFQTHVHKSPWNYAVQSSVTADEIKDAMAMCIGA